MATPTETPRNESKLVDFDKPEIILSKHSRNLSDMRTEMREKKTSDAMLPLQRKVTMFKGEKQRERIHGWGWVRLNLKTIIEFGRIEGILPTLAPEDLTELNESTNVFGINAGEDGGEERKKGSEEKKEEYGGLNLPDPPAEDSCIHNAVPYLPLSLALFCFAVNFVVPGLGTVLSGVLGLCFGLPRVSVKEGKRLVGLVVNFAVGVAQFMTLSFFLVGWFWSVAWGGMMVVHALQYRQALQEKRQEMAATAALEVFTKNTILHRSNLKSIIKQHKHDQKQTAPAVKSK